MSFYNIVHDDPKFQAAANRAMSAQITQTTELLERIEERLNALQPGTQYLEFELHELRAFYSAAGMENRQMRRKRAKGKDLRMSRFHVRKFLQIGRDRIAYAIANRLTA